jgi:tRNA (guanine-N7-)-methyltransferase
MTEDPAISPLHHRIVRSYVVRGGRLTAGQQRAMEELWPTFGVAFDQHELDLDSLFARQSTRVLEIGFGDGKHLAVLAELNRDVDFLGIEVHPPGVGHLLLQAEKAQLTNLRIISHDAVEVLTDQIAAASLDRVQVLFPDPWHKTRHHKRRLVNARFADLVARALRTGGVLQLATDWTPYAEVMLEVLNPHPAFKNLSADQTYMARDARRSPTRFERRGERLGHTVHDLCFERLGGLGQS